MEPLKIACLYLLQRVICIFKKDCFLKTLHGITENVLLVFTLVLSIETLKMTLSVLKMTLSVLLSHKHDIQYMLLLTFQRDSENFLLILAFSLQSKLFITYISQRQLNLLACNGFAYIFLL